MGDKVKEISVFVDESGSFDPSVEASRFYLVCMVFHDQDKAIADGVQKLNDALAELGLPEDHAVHAGPLVRWEPPYRTYQGSKRRAIFSRMMSFVRKSEITYHCFCVDKRTVDDYASLRKRLLREITSFLTAKMEDLNAYDKIKIYYDNGQSDVLSILQESFKSFNPRVEFIENVTPAKYRLFQAADMIATLELIKAKLKTDGHITVSEKGFFESIQKLNRVYLKPLSRKLWE